MLYSRKYSQIIFWSFILLYINEVLRWVPLVKIPIDNFFFLLYLSLFCLIYIYIKTPWQKDFPFKAIKIYRLFLMYNMVVLFRGILGDNGYLEWKKMFTSIDGGLSLLLPLSMLVTPNLIYVKKVLKFSISTFFYSIMFIPIFLFTKDDIQKYAPLTTPIVFFILLLPYYKRKEKLIFMIILVFTVFLGIAWRANLLRIFLSLSIVSVYYLKSWISEKTLRIAQYALILIPICFIYLSTEGTNIFEVASTQSKFNYSFGDKHGYGEETLVDDTRTFLYKEVFNDLYNNNQTIFGKGITGKYKSLYFYEGELRSGRPSTEVGFLNIILYSGIVGFLVYSLVLWYAVYYGTKQTNNTLTKLLSLFIIGHWCVLFLENVPSYNMYYYYNWIAIGLCFSNTVRNLTDLEIKNWLQYNN